MKRHLTALRRPHPIVVAALTGLLGACNLVFGIQGGVAEGTGGHGGSGASTASSGGHGGTATTSSSGGATTTSGSGGTLATGGSGGTLATGGGGGGGDAADAGDGSTDTDGGGPVSLAGCVLLLHLDETSWSGAGAVKDSSGQANHGTAMGTAVPTAGGKLGGAAALDGNGYIDIPNAASLQPTTALTYAAWVYPTGNNGGASGFAPGIVSKRQAFDSNVSFTLFFWDQDHAYADIQGARLQTNAVFPNGQWYHLAVVYDGTLTDANERARIYVNGELDVTHAADPSLAANTVDLRVGDLPGGGNMFVGRIDEVAVWTRALAPAEIKSLYEGKGYQ